MRLSVARCLILLCFAMLPAAYPTSAQSPALLEGNYSGTLQAGEAKLHLVLHLSKTPSGSLHATLDSLDQGVFSIEANSASISTGTMKLEVTSVGANFEGKISPDHQTIDGVWTQGSASLPLVFHRQASGSGTKKPTATVSPVEGVWQGALEHHGMRLRVQLHVSHDSEGELVAGLDSLDQGISGLPAMNVTQKNSSFHFEVPAMGSLYDGSLGPARNTLNGDWTQPGASQKLDFKRSDQPLELRRPQTPSKPYPYREEQISFSNPQAGVNLEGTLTFPPGPGPFPLAILIAGSGPHDRDESLANHRPFLVLADYLTRRGIAVFRYDKRGIGKSTGNVDNSTTLDFAADTEAAIALLKTRKDIDSARIGLIGHSEGAMIAPYIAAHSKDVAWIVLLAAPATKGEDTLLKQSELIGRAGGLSDPQLLASLSFDQAAYDMARKEKDSAVLLEKLGGLVKESGFDSAIPPAALETQLRMLSSPWFRFFLDYNPLPVLQSVHCPVLALYGERDLQVPPLANLALLQKALQDAGNTDVDARELPELNHLFQHAYTGSPAEYSAIEETFSPSVLDIISVWLLHHSSPAS